MTQILDYSAGYPGALAIQRLGYVGVIRYLRKEGTSRVQPLTQAEVADMRAYGLTIALVYQAVSSSRILEGSPAGAHDGQWALAQAHAVGIEPRAIYFAADQDIDSTELPRVLAYLDGAASVLGRERVGIYGEASVVDAAVPAHATYGWQTAAWSGGRRAARAHLFQRIGQVTVGGVSCDINDVLAEDYGQDPAPQEDDMALTQADGNTEWAAVDPDVRNPDGTEHVEAHPVAHWIGISAYRTARIQDQLDKLAEKVDKLAGGVTADQLTAVVRAELPGALARALVELASPAAPAVSGPIEGSVG